MSALRRVIGRNAITASSPIADPPRGPAAGSHVVQYVCDAGHTTAVRLWVEAEIPESWACRVCGGFAWSAPPVPGGEDRKTGPWHAGEKDPWQPKTHWEQLCDRRTEEQLEALLQEQLDRLRARRALPAA